MKKILILILLFTVGLNKVGVANISLVVSGMGVGKSNPRLSLKEDNPFAGVDLYGELSWTPVGQFTVLYQFLSFLAVETGMGYGFSEAKFIAGNENNSFVMKKNEIRIPLMLRTIISFPMGNIYVSSGLKFGIPLAKYIDETNIYGVDIVSSDFTLDIPIAFGLEIAIAPIYSFIGIRMDYDINVLSPIKGNDIYFDQFAFSIYMRIPIL